MQSTGEPNPHSPLAEFMSCWVKNSTNTIYIACCFFFPLALPLYTLPSTRVAHLFNELQLLSKTKQKIEHYKICRKHSHVFNCGCIWFHQGILFWIWMRHQCDISLDNDFLPPFLESKFYCPSWCECFHYYDVTSLMILVQPSSIFSF